jgi:kynureninase
MNYKPVIDAEELRKHYSKTLSSDRVLLTAHSHQAWPDIVEEAQLEAVRTAFKFVDLKWDYVFGELIPKFCHLISERAGIKNPELIANGENTHELVTRVLSCFKWDSSTNIVTTDSEFHSLKRQLYRLKEEGVKINFIPSADKKDLTGRIIEALKPGTDLLIISSVFFNDGFVLQDVKNIIERAEETGTAVLLDAYHQFNIRRMNISELSENIFVTAGGYKYAGSGEGAAWLKIPEINNFRPRITGWFADFDSLKEKEYPYPVKYGSGAQKFSGATRDMSGIFRQTAVLEFMNENGLTVEILEKNNLIQTAYLINIFDDINLEEKNVYLVSSRDDNERGPFLTLDMVTPERADKASKELWDKFKVLTDTRGKNLRIGPAPYTTQAEMEYGMESLKQVLKVSEEPALRQK